MKKEQTIDYEMPEELIRQYLESLKSLSDIRLQILLIYNAYEEIIKSFAAWRLTCSPDNLPYKNNNIFLLAIVLSGSTDKNLRRNIDKFRDLRNSVAHKFHLNIYKQNLKEFVEIMLEKPLPLKELDIKTALFEAFSLLVFKIVSHVSQITQRGEWPFPNLYLEICRAS